MDQDLSSLSLKEALVADMLTDTGISTKTKESIVSAIAAICQQAGVNVDRPASNLTEAEIKILQGLELVFHKIVTAALR